MRSFSLVAVFVLFPDLAHACAVCGFGADESRAAYIGTTVLLSVLPLSVIGGIVFYVWRHHERTAPAASTGPKAVTPLRGEDRPRAVRAS